MHPERRKRRNQKSNQQAKNGNKMVTPEEKCYKKLREHMFGKNPQTLDFIEFRERSRELAESKIRHL